MHRIKNENTNVDSWKMNKLKWNYNYYNERDKKFKGNTQQRLSEYKRKNKVNRILKEIEGSQNQYEQK